MMIRFVRMFYCDHGYDDYDVDSDKIFESQTPELSDFADTKIFVGRDRLPTHVNHLQNYRMPGMVGN